MNVTRLIRLMESISAVVTVMGAAIRILHVLPAWDKMMHVGILLFLMTETIRYRFSMPVKSWQHHVRFTAYVASILLMGLTWVFGVDLLPFVLLLLTVAFSLQVFSPTRTAAT